jgi:hypothetical protein
MNSTLDHDADILAFFIRLYHVGVPLLFRRTEDPNASRPSASFKATFVAPNYLAPFILSPISVLFSPLEAFSYHFRSKRGLFLANQLVMPSSLSNRYRVLL